MVININPNRIRLSTGNTGKFPERRSDEYAAVAPAPKRAHVNYVPPPEALRTLIANAVDALKRGVRFDRGSILNLLA